MAQLYLKKLKAQYAYLKAECEYNDDIYKDAIDEFNEHFKDKINLKTDEKELKTTKRVPMIDKKKLKPTVNKIYKKLAQKLHPDKATGTEEAFRELQQSIEKKDMDRVIELAEEYKVDISPMVDTEEFYTEHIRFRRKAQATKYYTGDAVAQSGRIYQGTVRTKNYFTLW
jgi:hypothetical protein